MPAKKKTEITAKQEIMAPWEHLNYAQGSDDTSTTRQRRNKAADITRSDKYTNIDEFPLPFRFSIGYTGAQIDARDIVILCQKAYFNIPLVRNIIDLMTEFSVGDIYFKEGTKVSRDFFSAWLEKIGQYSIQDRFYREYFRSGNVFVWRSDTVVQPGDVRKIISTFGLTTTKALVQIDVPEMKLPSRYFVLNPADIMFSGSISFYSGLYYKRLSDFELQRLRKPRTDEDLEVLKSIPPDVRKTIENTKVGSVLLPLDANMVTVCFYKKQDYEPFSAPMIHGILEDLNAKLELKRLDMAIARTMNQVILMVTTGTEPEKGGINQQNLISLQKLFDNQSIGRVLIADWTTKAEFVVPKIGEILTAQKYEQLEKDINIGLNNILIGGEKFANQSTKVDVFLARLEHARRVFLDEFLKPEIRRISKSLGFKGYPIPYYNDIKLKNNDIREKVYLRLTELGILTPDEIFEALDTGRLPDSEQGVDDQQAYKDNRDKGMYMPLIGPGAMGGAGAAGGAEGRPMGTPAPQTTKKISPIGTKTAFSSLKLMDNMKAATALSETVAGLLKTKFKKKKLSEEQQNIATEISKLIICNEEPAKWQETAASYVEKPIERNKERVDKIHNLAIKYDCDEYLASMLLVSQTDKKE